ncbi:MAG: hypothetical protein RJB66_1896, partial [Pseudomonadota bacterium]
LKVHVFEMVGLEIELFVVATPVKMNFAIEGIELLGAIDSHGEGAEANCVTRRESIYGQIASGGCAEMDGDRTPSPFDDC